MYEDVLTNAKLVELYDAPSIGTALSKKQLKNAKRNKNRKKKGQGNNADDDDDNED